MSSDHRHSHGVGWPTLVLLVVAAIQVFAYALPFGDSLVKANGYHDFFDVVFLLVLIVAARENSLRWHVLRHNAGPFAVGLVATLSFFLILIELRGDSHHEPKNLASVVLLLVSAAASYNVLAAEMSDKTGIQRIKSLHFTLDVGGSLVAACVAAVDLVRDIGQLRIISTWGLALLVAVVVIFIWREVLEMLHYQSNCPEPEPERP